MVRPVTRQRSKFVSVLSATAVTGALTIAGAGLLTTPASAAGDGGGPTITETFGPANGSSIPYGQVPALGFACADTGGATIIKCSAVDEDGNAFTSGTQVGNGTGVNAGNYSVTISALDTNGNTATLIIAYTVTPLTQTISFLSSPPSPAIYSGHYLVSTSTPGGSGNPVVLSLLQGSGTVCTLTGSTIVFVGVGTCQVGATEAGNIDWAAAPPISQTFTVTPTPLTITASSATIFYGQAIPAVTPIYSGFVLGQSASAFSNQPICTVPATIASNAGTYATSCVGAVDPNYAFTYVNGSLVIKPAPTSLAATPAVISVLPLVPYLFTLNTAADLERHWKGHSQPAGGLQHPWWSASGLRNHQCKWHHVRPDPA